MIAQRDETRTTAPTVPGLLDQQQRPDSDSDSSAVKQRATFTAKLAMLGYSLHELSSGSFLVCRWDRSRHLADLRAVASFLRQAGGAM